jgi:hypothetical protein
MHQVVDGEWRQPSSARTVEVDARQRERIRLKWIMVGLMFAAAVVLSLAGCAGSDLRHADLYFAGAQSKLENVQGFNECDYASVSGERAEVCAAFGQLVTGRSILHGVLGLPSIQVPTLAPPIPRATRTPEAGAD